MRADKVNKAAILQQQLDEAEAKKQKVYRWVRFGISLWAIRMGFAMIGMCLPIAIQLYHDLFPVPARGYTSTMTTLEWMDVVKSDFKLIGDARTSAQPLLLRGVPLISPLALRLAFQSRLPVSTMQAKISDEPVYTHFSIDRLWAQQYRMPRSYSYATLGEYLSAAFQSTHKLDPFELLDQLLVDDYSEALVCSKGESGYCDDQPPEIAKSFMYTMFTPLNAYVNALVPALSHLHASQSTDAQVSLWLSSPNVSATLHYDMDDNFLLQVSGTKRVLLVSPAAYTALGLHSSYHPHWRQVQSGATLLTAASVHSALQDFESAHRYPNSTTDAMIWEVTLHPGQMVYIPAGVFHAVTAGNDSVSVNSWFSSTLSEAYSGLQNIHLPFESHDSREAQLVSLVQLLKQLVQKHRLVADYSLFVSSLRARYSQAAENSLFQCSSFKPPLLCSSNDAQIAATKKLISRVAGNFHALLSYSGMSEAVTVILLQDYFEEVLPLVLPAHELSPCFMQSLVDQCF